MVTQKVLSYRMLRYYWWTTVDFFGSWVSEFNWNCTICRSCRWTKSGSAGLK